jgi:hypothetical protein
MLGERGVLAATFCAEEDTPRFRTIFLDNRDCALFQAGLELKDNPELKVDKSALI